MEKKRMISYLRVYFVAFMMFMAANVYGQNISVSGTVRDTNGEPVIGATVRERGVKNAVITDVNGQYKISCSPKATLEIDFIGYQKKVININGRKNLNVSLTSDTKGLDEVVVVGYGTQKKVNVTGSVSMVGSEVLESRPVANVTQALQGAIPGLNLTTTTSGGRLDNTLSMSIRGQGSINGGDDPLVLIDGIEGDINNINPNDIESISVLKDAASSSIYGSRAAFGVVLVTTKSAKEGKVKVSYSGDVRFSTATQLPDMVNSLEFANYFNVASTNSGSGVVFNDETMENIRKYMNGEFTDPTQPEYYGTTRDAGSNTWKTYAGSFANTNWFDEFYRKNVPSTQHNLSISGGTDAVNYVISGGFLNENGLLRHGKDQMNRYNISAKINARLASWARAEYDTRWSRQDYQQPTYLTYWSGVFFHNIARRWPTNPVYDPNGNYMDGMEINELEEGGKYQRTRDDLTQKIRFILTPLTGWNITAEGAMRTQNYRTTSHLLSWTMHDCDNTPSEGWYDNNKTSYAKDTRYRYNYYAINVFTDYTRSFGLNNFKALVGLNYEKYDNDQLTSTGYNLITDTKPYLSDAQDDFKTSDSYYHHAVAGYFGRLNYDYDGRYLAEFNLRYDGSSRFLAEKRWAWFPSISAGWNMAKEKFFKPLSETVQTLKIRASWGQLGNTNSSYSSFSDYYPFYQQQSTSAAASSWLINGEKQNTASLPSIINTVLTWETIETWDVGFDWGLFNNRLTGSFDWFNRTTRDMVGPAETLGSVLGANSPDTNNCDMRSRGWEIEVSWRDKIGDFGYNIRVNLADSKQKILKYPYTGSLEDISLSDYYYEGYNVGDIFGLTAIGIANTQEEMDAHLAKVDQSAFGSTWGAGDMMYADLNGDGVLNSGAWTLGDHGDYSIIGNDTPRYRIGINLGASYKGVDFSMFFQGVLKRDWDPGSNNPYFFGACGSMWQSCCFKEHLDYWSEENTDAYYPKPYLTDEDRAFQDQTTSTRWIQNAAYLRCKNIQLGYTLPDKWTRKAGISNCRFYVSCDNLFTITKLNKIFDPETLDGMWDSGKTYPLQRTWAVGVSLNLNGSSKKAK